MSDWFLSYWSNNPNPPEQQYMGIYGGLVAFAVLSSVVTGIYYYGVRHLNVVREAFLCCVIG